MTGKTDMVPVSNLPSHLSQPSRRVKTPNKVSVEFVPILTKRTTADFHRENLRFWGKTNGRKGNFPATPHLAPVARRVAACGPLCGLVRRRWGTDTTQSIWERVGELFGAPKAKQEKGVGSCPAHPGHFCPQCGQFHRVSHRGRKTVFPTGGGVENRKSPAVTGKTAGSQQNFKEENENDKQQRKHRCTRGTNEMK